jgi:hypothetical protein
VSKVEKSPISARRRPLSNLNSHRGPKLNLF